MSASVEVIFDNNDEQMSLPTGVKPKPNNEVSIRRTIGLKKDDYQINDRNITRGDMIRMLESVGFSMSNPYNIVPQGKIIALTNAKDKERLLLLEEVVGAKSFENKLQASLLKMDETEQKRFQINKEMKELENKLNEMEQEKIELEKYNNLEKNKKVIQFNLYDRELNDIINQIEKLDIEYNSILISSEKYLQELDKRELIIEQLKMKLNHIEDELKIKNQSEFEELNNTKDAISQKITNYQIKIKEFENKIKTNKSQLKINNQNLKLLDELINEKQLELNEIKPQYEELNNVNQDLKFEINKLKDQEKILIIKNNKYSQFANIEERNEWIQEEINNLNLNLTTLNNTCKGLEDEEMDLTREFDEINQKIQDLNTSINESTITIDEIEHEIKDLNEMYTKEIDKRKELWREENKLDTVLETNLDSINRIERSINENIDYSLSQGISNVKEIVNKLNIPETSIYGTLGELIKVSEKYKRCVEIIAGNSLFNIIVDTDETASQIMNELIRMQNGRVTFIPLNRIENGVNINYPSNEESNCTALIKKIKYDKKFEKVIRNVFGKTIVVKDLQLGNRLCKEFKLQAITLDGDRIDSKGVVSGGYFNINRRSRLDNLKELQRSRNVYKNTMKELAQIKDEISQIDDEIDKINAEIREVSGKRERVMIKNEDGRLKLNQSKTQLYNLEETMVNVKNKREQMEKNVLLNEAKLKEYELEMNKEFVNGNDGELGDGDDELRDISLQLKSKEEKMLQQNESLMALQIQMDELKAELESKLIRQRDEVELKILQCDNEGMEEELKNLQYQEMDETKAMETIENDIDKMYKDLKELKERKGKENEVLNKANSQQMLLVETLEKYKQDVEKIMIKRSTLNKRKVEVETQIREVGLISEDALTKYTDIQSEELVEQLNDCNDQMKEFSNVNKRALENFKKFHGKREELMGRSHELEESEESIKELIDNLKEQKVNAVERTFNQVSENFSDIFEQLVPRGTGELVIGRQGQEYSGVSIQVSFNSKNDEQLQIEQLSGGQKTVCAIALILAIQQVDPAPFYLFDEIDAALDKEYRKSVSQVIKRLSQNGTQFILTTFRSDMIEIADMIYMVKYHNKVSSVYETNKTIAMNFVKGK
ncbi:hypothetical protein TBLA_0C02740 [Henningerozyma blattae CBS 6284]|uniref:SMC hinge domain-containing protein n=1 Tax=Henningerozyma blattae (strain ATCC 34711 / CBS 6284 / DSM 70876 / NBRC 10599 / NRRL Y-10934 / UCD 77-7) TaxID=1071380 RepID=I2H130_HENB6|nr:hypothetical protein TBLA_0C02740 [Tetrapisispora blattae CBS 6284]CCH60082.1 hypothetical protein TBLA_0C02740 [Tetrapisispora blattae CBS 6284]